jgi:MinD-like ATPase involved in chromosome partitioning or flagellar assembly
LDLPTYTNIWRIEKRLYKLYDFRLPMPIPVGQIAVFAAISVPYLVILKVAGLPFSHTLLWLYILPPGALAWLVTRPVLEGKRLPELVVSQVRYLAEPRTWCRMAPLAEKDEILVVARVWRRAPGRLADDEIEAAGPELAEVAVADLAVAAVAAAGVAVAGVTAASAAGRPALAEAARAPEPARAAAQPTPPAPQRSRPMITVTGEGAGERPIRMVERALASPAERRGAGWGDRVVVVPGGHRPGRPDQMQRDRARARLPVPRGCRVVVLGCTVGAGQTMTTLMTGEVLASLRDDQVAALDLNPGPGSLAERAAEVPSLTGSGPGLPPRLEVVTREAAADPRADDDPQEATAIFELVSARYPLTLADPGPPVVPRVLAVAGQLVLVAPASQDAASALAATQEWLEANGHGDLAEGAIVVLNGVSPRTMPHVEQAEALARGRYRAIMRVPWDDRLNNHEEERTDSSSPTARQAGLARPLSPAALHAYTALAGLLVAAVTNVPEQLRVRS